jgi:CheY-like chemotaxis protein
MQSPIRLLLADDEHYVTTVLSQKLRDRFGEVLTAGDGEEALALALESVPTLVVSDYQMPLMDGFELACRLRQDPRTASVPVILLTARGHLLSPEQLARTNVQRCLSKPFSIKQIVAVLDELLKPGDRQAA